MNWTDLTGIKLPFNYKIQSLETEDLDALFAVYVSNLSVACLGDLFTWMQEKNWGIHLPVL